MIIATEIKTTQQVLVRETATNVAELIAPGPQGPVGPQGPSTSLNVANRTSTTLDITSDTGADATVPAATTSLAGLLSAADKERVDDSENFAIAMSIALG